MPVFSATAVTAAVLVGAGAVGTYLLWPVTGPAALMMKALGAARFFISRAVFLANPQLYFELLRTAGAAAAAAAFAA
ncbi:protein EGG APPARATUS-1-like [Triticum urartu]|uniref:protein EGG APPARATUS-1-like n=1 Tax=Triticum urartu TaxID=4572 RepID=UPI0020440842|nr:protein EGG APPARATUS-1-like [Triticum urartu]XP_048527270.1 protein EGG APPARATUS-1-like [Triticum urartu]